MQGSSLGNRVGHQARTGRTANVATIHWYDGNAHGYDCDNGGRGGGGGWSGGGECAGGGVITDCGGGGGWGGGGDCGGGGATTDCGGGGAC